MKIQKVIEICDALYENNIPKEQKIQWLDELGALLKKEYHKTYKDGVQEEYTPISDEFTDETVAYAPYYGMYIDYLIAKCNYYNRDFAGYNQHMGYFNTMLMRFGEDFIRNNMPKNGKITGFW